MTSPWYEVWADETPEQPYLLLVGGDPLSASGVEVRDPAEGYHVVQRFPNYAAAKDWLLEDEYTLVSGRTEPE